MVHEKVRYMPSGDCTLIMEFGNEINPRIIKRIRELAALLENSKINGVVEWVPTYRSILISYRPAIISGSRLIEILEGLEANRGEMELSPPLVTEIPTFYGGEYGPDLEYVAAHNSLTVEEVVSIHSGTDYLIYMLGFTPGFPYLGGMSDKIAVPRLKTPREKIPGGSVGIAGTQTGIYPIDSPGGWQLIGKTPLKLFDQEAEEPFLLQAGNYLRFVPVTEKEFIEIEDKVKSREYRVNTYPLDSTL